MKKFGLTLRIFKLNWFEAVFRLETGNTSNIKWFAGIGELKINWGPGYLVYLAKDGEALIVLFGGGTKQRQQANIEKAFALHAEYKERKVILKKRDKAKRSR